jgi:putative ABC transport system substrate-binding protein
VQIAAARVSIASEIAPAITDFARRPNGAIIITPDALTAVNLGQIVALSNQHHLPSIFPLRMFPASGGLLSYGTDLADIYRGVATYADRILKGERPSDLPIQNPTRYKIVVNLRTAKAIGLAIPESFLLRADEVIE